MLKLTATQGSVGLQPTLHSGIEGDYPVPHHEPYITFARQQVADILQREQGWQPYPADSCKLLVTNESGEEVSLDLTPAHATPQAPTAHAYFDTVRTTTQLLDAYNQARRAYRFEDDL